jgi:N-acetylmuramoyl-L-alanine amidase
MSRLAAMMLIVVAAPIQAQGVPRLEVERGDGTSMTIDVVLDRGYAAVPASVLESLGWTVTEGAGALSLSAAGEISVSMRLASPFFRWDGIVLQMADNPYRSGGTSFVPLQFLTDFLPRRLPGLYEYDGPRSLLRAGDLALLTEGAPEGLVNQAPSGGGTAVPEAAVTPPLPDPNSAETVRARRPTSYYGTRVVVIDAGHGGADPGALGPGGVSEKNIALGVALYLAERLRGQPDLEVVMIRDDDTFVDIWERGQIATAARGERPGVFVSIHANSFPARREARGFETYFLSDARTEHERRVSAIENAPISMNPSNDDTEQVADLDFILRDLTNYDHAHWSEDLAGLVQEEMDDFHPGPNRGVKQGVLAVLTNALMPSVLVELGYLSNESEAELIRSAQFQADAAEAVGDAVLRFFERYPPGTGSGQR